MSVSPAERFLFRVFFSGYSLDGSTSNNLFAVLFLNYCTCIGAKSGHFNMELQIYNSVIPEILTDYIKTSGYIYKACSAP